jgi:hypothetical protein
MRGLIYVAAVAGTIILLQISWDALSPDPVVVCAIVAIVAFGTFTAGRAFGSPINPMTVYAALILTVVVGVVWVTMLAALGPVAVTTLIIVLSAITLWLRIVRGDAQRKRREHAGLCGRCGYDLRASPDVCPKCGAVVNEELKRRRRIAAALAAERARRGPLPPPLASIADDIPAAGSQGV